MMIEYQFTALQNFWCEETLSQYVAGLTYTIRDPVSYIQPAAKQRCEALIALIPQWIAEGKVCLGGASGGQVIGI